MRYFLALVFLFAPLVSFGEDFSIQDQARVNRALLRETGMISELEPIEEEKLEEVSAEEESAEQGSAEEENEE